MELIPELSRTRPLRELTELYTSWCDIGMYKQFIICFKSDLMLTIEVQFSCNEEEQKDVMFKLICNGMSTLYKYSKDEVKLKYARLKITNKCGADCNELLLYFFGCDRYQQAPQAPKVSFSEPLSNLRATIAEPSQESPRGLSFPSIPESPTKSRFKSPFKKDRPKSNLSEAPKPRPPPIKDNRIPDSLPECVLVGQKGGGYKHLKGMPDQYLKMGRDGLEFSFLYPTDSMDTSQWDLK